MTTRICKLKGKHPKKVYNRMMKQYKRENKKIVRIRELYSGRFVSAVYVFKDIKRHRGKWRNKDNTVKLYKPHHFGYQGSLSTINLDLLEIHFNGKSIMDKIKSL